eukprot:7301276-Pyramimonas_sp.AAC.1
MEKVATELEEHSSMSRRMRSGHARLQRGLKWLNFRGSMYSHFLVKLLTVATSGPSPKPCWALSSRGRRPRRSFSHSPSWA